MWLQNYNPLHSALLSTLAAGAPVVVLLGSIGLFRVRIHFAALLGLGVALAVALGIFHMPARALAAATSYGAAFGIFPIGWIILNVIFLYQLTLKQGLFEILRDSLGKVAPDPRLQVILIAFAFGAFAEGIAGFGTPVAITAAILIQLGFRPLHASGLALIANTAPVAFGSLGIPITTLEQVTGLDAYKLSAMVGRQLPFFSLFLPFWVVAAFAGWRRAWEVWPAALVAGIFFAVPQFLVSNLHGPWLVDIISGGCSMASLLVLFRWWRPAKAMEQEREPGEAATTASPRKTWSGKDVWRAWLPWLLLTCLIFIWGLPQVKRALDQVASPSVQVPYLHHLVQRVPPVVPMGSPPETAEFKLNVLSATGTGILVAAVLAGLMMGVGPKGLAQTYMETVWRIRYSLLTIAAMLALGTVTKFSGADATLGLALAHTGRFYPFFGTLLGWLGVALTGSDTASNVLFGSLQRITAENTGFSPILMTAANSSGGVMGKMVDAQSIVVASTATGWYGHEGSILRYVFFHSVILAALMGLLVLLQAYFPLFHRLVVP